MRLVVTALCALTLATTPFAATAHDGPYDHGPFSVLADVNAKPVDQIGDDVIRVSTTPALGGRAWVIELHRNADGSAIGVADLGFSGRGGNGWTDLGSLKVGLSAERFAALSAKIDGLLARGEPVPETSANVVHICTDGPGYVTERRKNGRSEWMSGFCGDHPNNQIAKLMLAVVWGEVCLYGPTVAPCPPDISRPG